MLCTDLEDIQPLGQCTTVVLSISCTTAISDFLSDVVEERVAERMLKANIQPVADWVGEDSQLLLNAVDAEDGDFHGGKGWDGLLPLIVEGRDTIGVGAEIE